MSAVDEYRRQTAYLTGGKHKEAADAAIAELEDRLTQAADDVKQASKHASFMEKQRDDTAIDLVQAKAERDRWEWVCRHAVHESSLWRGWTDEQVIEYYSVHYDADIKDADRG